MRFLTSLVSILIFLLLVLGTGLYFTREYFLYRGVENFKKQVLTLRKAGSSACTNKADLLDVVADNTAPVSQIRFTSDTEYVLEVVCPGYTFAPIILGKGKLDRFISKVPGTSGILLGEARTGVELAAFADVQKQVNTWLNRNFPYIEKTKSVVLENNQFIVVQSNEDLGAGPIASCEGFGYQCCQPDSQIGVGNNMPGLVGCEKTCYSACASRPVVLSFTSNPFYDIKDRTVRISGNESVDFAYVIDPGAAKSGSVLLDFGDGKSDQASELTGLLSHSYTCASSSCQYSAVLKAIDNVGVESAQTQISQIRVIVSAR